MKRFSLVLSVGLTLVIFSISFVSHQGAQSYSLEVSKFILRIITDLFPNNSIALVSLNNFVHIIIHMILGVTWFLTAKLWGLSLMRVLLIGLMITSVDEIIQIAYLNENPSFGNTLLMDFVPFMMMSIMLFLINNNKSVKSVNMADTLVKLEHGTITSKEAYKEMYSTRHQRMYVTNNAHFLRLRIVVPDDKSANKLLGVLFFLPIPLGLVRFAMNFVKEEHLKESPFSREELMNMINSKNINVQVNASDKTKVIIKTI